METWTELLRPCQLLQHSHKGKPKTVSLKGLWKFSSMCCELLPSTRDCNSTVNNSKSLQRLESQLWRCFLLWRRYTSSPAERKKTNQTELWVLLQNQTVYFLLIICKMVLVWRCDSKCCKYFVVLDSVFYLEDNVCFIEVIVFLPFFQFLVLKKWSIQVLFFKS